jgi:hypothetical protein
MRRSVHESRENLNAGTLPTLPRLLRTRTYCEATHSCRTAPNPTREQCLQRVNGRNRTLRLTSLWISCSSNDNSATN